MAAGRTLQPPIIALQYVYDRLVSAREHRPRKVRRREQRPERINQSKFDVTDNEAGVIEGPTISFVLPKLFFKKPNCKLDAIFWFSSMSGGGPEAAAFVFAADTVVT